MIVFPPSSAISYGLKALMHVQNSVLKVCPDLLLCKQQICMHSHTIPVLIHEVQRLVVEICVSGSGLRQN